MEKKARRRYGMGWKKFSTIVVTLTAAVSLYQQAERAVVTTVHDINSFVYPSEPVIYSGLEAIRVKPEWPMQVQKPGNFPHLP